MPTNNRQQLTGTAITYFLKENDVPSVGTLI